MKKEIKRVVMSLFIVGMLIGVTGCASAKKEVAVSDSILEETKSAEVEKEDTTKEEKIHIRYAKRVEEP